MAILESILFSYYFSANVSFHHDDVDGALNQLSSLRDLNIPLRVKEFSDRTSNDAVDNSVSHSYRKEKQQYIYIYIHKYAFDTMLWFLKQLEITCCK